VERRVGRRSHVLDLSQPNPTHNCRMFGCRKNTAEFNIVTSCNLLHYFITTLSIHTSYLLKHQSSCSQCCLQTYMFALWATQILHNNQSSVLSPSPSFRCSAVFCFLAVCRSRTSLAFHTLSSHFQGTMLVLDSEFCYCLLAIMCACISHCSL